MPSKNRRIPYEPFLPLDALRGLSVLTGILNDARDLVGKFELELASVGESLTLKQRQALYANALIAAAIVVKERLEVTESLS